MTVDWRMQNCNKKEGLVRQFYQGYRKGGGGGETT